MSLVQNAKKHYWQLGAQLDRLRLLVAPERKAFAREVLRSHWWHISGNVGLHIDNDKSALDAAIDWLLRAQSSTRDDGFSLGYFPCDREGGWRPSYPETTGYIIPTLIEYARQRGSNLILERALAAARWETTVQMSNGAVQGGPVCPSAQQKAAVFNTGMVLHGWSAAFRESGDRLFLEAGRRAADFLVHDLDGDGHFRTHGEFVTAAPIKTYNVLCAWALHKFSEDIGDERYAVAAIRNATATITQQLENGWFENNDLGDPEHPLTHTIGYTLQGLLELGVDAGRVDLIEAARRGVEPMLGAIVDNGFLPGRFSRDWKPAQRSSCLTGSAQIAIVLFRLFQLTGSQRYGEAGDRLTNFLKVLQRHDCGDPNVNGALAGSFPLMGEYMTAGYPNWAAKYFADSLMLQNRLRSNEIDRSC